MGPSPAVAATRSAVRACLALTPSVQAGDLVLVACSGGADSLALAAATAFEARRSGVRVGGVTVDHDLQVGSAERAATVAGVLQKLGLHPVISRRVDVVVGPATGGPEAAARTARHDALRDVAGEHGAAAVLLGHSRDDQAETVLLGLARGSGARSLAGMAPVRGLLRRPFLGLDRALLRTACADGGLEPWDDPHNADPAYARVRVRSTVLPLLEDELGPGIPAALARTAALLRADADALDRLAEDALAEARCDGALDARRLAGLLPAVRTRVLRLAAVAAGCPAGALTAGHIDETDRLVTDWHGQRWVDLPGQVRALRRCDRLHLTWGSGQEREPS